MKYKRAVIDSLNLSDCHFEAIFIHNEDYRIETVKSNLIFEPKIWSRAFGKSLTKNITEAKIIHTYRGVRLPLKTFANTPLRQTVEFAGFHGYNDRSEQLVIIFNELQSQLKYTRIMRIDVAIDYPERIPSRIIKAICKTRKPYIPKRYPDTTYYKTSKEKKTNQKMDIKIYNKAVKENLDYPLKRLEFVFKGNYFNKLLLKDLDLAIKKMEKSIKRATGLNVKIKGI